MILVLDGYNVLKTVYGVDVSETQRDRYLADLKSYAEKKNHRIVVIFDGGPFSWVSLAEKGKVSIIYAGAGRTADDIIKQYLYEQREKDILLVTNDREITSFASMLKIQSVEVSVFNYYLKEATEAPSERKKIPSNRIQKFNKTDEQLDRLMVSYFVENQKNDEEQDKVPRHHGNKKVSKKERRYLSQLKKL